LRRKFVLAAVGFAVGAMLLLPGASTASHDPSGAPFDEDFAVGSHLLETSDLRVLLDFSAHSGPKGEAPSGEFLFQLVVFFEPTLGRTDRGSVTCLRVEGHRATFGLALSEPAGRTAAVVGVSDEPGIDALYLQYRETVLGPVDCPASVDPLSVEISDLFILNPSGGITVHDAAPFAIEQCKNGGWRNFSTFKNQGDCVAFVVTPG
jgi:hypothetical protein